MPRKKFAILDIFISLILLLLNFQSSTSLLSTSKPTTSSTPTLTTTMGAATSSPEDPASDLPLEEQQEELVEETFTHLVILVHGYVGNDKDLAYFQDAITQKSKTFVSAGSSADQAAADETPKIVFHSAKANVGNTSDGIVNGGMRLAMEMDEQINKILQHEEQEQESAAHGGGRRRRHHVRLSIVAHSLGGLYSRYAISKINMDHVVPWVFCTASTPHLGVCNHTYIPIPRWAESTIGNFMKDTGRDLFCMTSIVQELATLPQYTTPLANFQKRVALANAFATDFLTPAGTSAFLSRDSMYKHETLWPTQDVYLLSVETIPDQEYDPKCMSQSLDRLGWTKVFLDVREQIPVPSIPIPTVFTNKQDQSSRQLDQNQPGVIQKKDTWTSSELFPLMNRPNGKWHVPMAHSVSIANSRDDFYVWLNQNGKKFMDQLANDMLHMMGFESNVDNVCSSNSNEDSNETPLDMDSTLLATTPESPVEDVVTGAIPVMA